MAKKKNCLNIYPETIGIIIIMGLAVIYIIGIIAMFVGSK